MLRSYYNKLIYYITYIKLVVQMVWLVCVVILRVFFLLLKFLIKYFFIGSFRTNSFSSEQFESPLKKPLPKSKLYELLNVSANANEGEIRKVRKQFYINQSIYYFITLQINLIASLVNFRVY